jgi:poly(hydroxyalkanoate) depolymerase family esterase
VQQRPTQAVRPPPDVAAWENGLRNLSDTMARLGALAHLPSAGPASGTGSRLKPLRDFGSNPGNLLGWTHIPADLSPGAALVVVLHGCTQNAAGYDRGAGWSDLAERHGFAVLLPEQQRANNANGCFNWFTPGDIVRDGGEALSIRQMIAALVAAQAIDPARIFVTGLSAGGAMTSTMLATYPEVFAGGAIIAGLPYGTARTMPEAFDRMRGHGGARGADLAALVRGASGHHGPWPTISVWHGTADNTVVPANADLIVDQWRTLHGVARPDHVDRVDGHVRKQWHDAAGGTVIEHYLIDGLGHGTPLATRGEAPCGVAGPHMLEAGISSTRHIAQGWGLIGAEKPVASALPETPPPPVPPRRPLVGGIDPGKVINDALRAAGLLR